MKSILVLTVSLLALATLPASTAVSDLDGAVFVDGSGAYLADFDWTGECNGPGAITVTIHRPTGDDVRQVAIDSVMAPDACFPVTCLDCPPVPLPVAWTMKGEGVLLAGGGSAAYDHYGYIELVWSLQGPFQEGTLEVHGVLG
jgi:hypothetical protein